MCFKVNKGQNKNRNDPKLDPWVAYLEGPCSDRQNQARVYVKNTFLSLRARFIMSTRDLISSGQNSAHLLLGQARP